MTRGEIVSAVGVALIVCVVLGGIWGGAFTATEAAGIGALAAMILAIVKGLRLKGIVEAVVDAGKTSAPIMILLVAAGMYSRFLALADIQSIIKDSLLSLGIGGFGIAIMMIVIWLLLGMVLDSISIILLTVPIFATFAPLVGMDGFAFAIFGILLIEAGLLTPPFGLVVYVVKGAVPDAAVSLAEIFRGSIPYWLLMLATAALIWAFPPIASWLTGFV